jgi:asparagine synthetase B (glutamine-hydrolysing)
MFATVFIGKNQIRYNLLSDLIENHLLSDAFYFHNGILHFSFSSHSNRYFFTLWEKELFISDSLKRLEKFCKFKKNDDALKFYKKYGFIYPPYTQYENVYLTNPYTNFTIENESVVFSLNPLEKGSRSDSGNLESILNHYFKSFKEKSLNVLVSGGIDSSALLGLLYSQNKVSNTIMCKMTSLPLEGALADRLTKSINIPLLTYDLDKDLTCRANELLSDKGEIIADSIALVFPELFESIDKPIGEVLYLVDGQGADSLLNGLPLNKIYNMWSKLAPVRLLIYPFSKTPIFQNKSTPLKRKFYRFSKALKCLSQTDFRLSILNAMVENDSIAEPLKLENIMLSDIGTLYKKYQDWHLVIRYLYMFKVLPAREMQKYLLADKYGVKIITPFLDEEVIKQLIFLDNDLTMTSGLYKYPITKLAQKYWPGFFETSKTSPFQVNFKIGTSDLKQYSIDFLNKNMTK